jgi:hypothetical protein
MTPDDLHTLAEMKELVDVVLTESGKALDSYAVLRDSHHINSMWANIAHPITARTCTFIRTAC